MDKEIFNRMLAKKERHRIKRKAKRCFLKKNPNWEENTMRSIGIAFLRKHVEETRFRNIFNKSRPPLFKKLQNAFQSVFRRRAK